MAKLPLVVFIALVGCGGTTQSSPAAPASSDAGASAPDAAPARQEPDATCSADDDTFRHCSTTDDCTLGTVAACSCGSTTVVVGVAKSRADDYDRCSKADLAASLADAGAACGGCAATSACMADDGRNADCAGGHSPIGVACVAGRCASFVSADAGADGG